MDAPLIEFKNVTKCFGERTVLDRVNLEVREGEVTTIIGKSGTGKSVLLKHMIGLLTPTDGEILFRGRPVAAMRRKELDELRSEFSYCFQNNALFDSLTVLENIALPLRQTTRWANGKSRTRRWNELRNWSSRRSRRNILPSFPAACRSASLWPAL